MFKDFISDMNLVEVKYVRKHWTWANYREGEGFVEERLDKFLASPEWTYQNPNFVVHHAQKQTSDHCLLMLENKPSRLHIAKRFYFDRRFLKVSDFEQVVNGAWNAQHFSTPMFQVCERIKSCGVALLKLRGKNKMNSDQDIMEINGKIESYRMKEDTEIGRNRSRNHLTTRPFSVLLISPTGRRLLKR